MPSSSKIKRKASAKSAHPEVSVIDSRQRELVARESQLQAEIDALQRTIAEAPVRAQIEARREREAYIQSSRGYALHSVVSDPRYGTGGRARKRPMLRAERRAARLQTFTLVVVLAGAVVWMLSHFLP